MVSTLALGRIETLGAAVLMFIPWLFSAPACTLAATLGPPPVRRLRGFSPQLVRSINALKTVGNRSVRSERPDDNFNKGYVLLIDRPT